MAVIPHRIAGSMEHGSTANVPAMGKTIAKWSLWKTSRLVENHSSHDLEMEGRMVLAEIYLQHLLEYLQIVTQLQGFFRGFHRWI